MARKKYTGLEIKMAKTMDLIPYARNSKIHTDQQIDEICESIKEFGMNDPVGVWHNKDGELEIVEGHGRVLALTRMNIEECPVIELDHLTDSQRKAYTHIHNQQTLSTGLDMEALEADLEELNFDWASFGFDIDNEEFEELASSGLDEEKYSQNIGKVIYEPKETNWEIGDLYKMERPDLVKKVEALENEELKEMLRHRISWFCEFNFARVADYYAYQATADEQRVLESLAMVLLDKDQLIENGFAEIVENV